MKRKLLYFFLFAALFSIAASLLRADVTIRYETTFKSALAGTAGFMPGPQQSTVRMKGNRGVTTEDGLTTIVDFAKQQITVVDMAHLKYATIPAAQYSGRMAGAFPVGASLHSKAESRATGRTEVIQGVPASEKEFIVTIDVPVPNVASGPGGTPLPPISMKMTIQMWTAQPDAVLRVPAVRELTGFQQWQEYFLNPVELLGKLQPGTGMEPLVAEMKNNNALMLRTHMSMSTSMPSVAGLAQTDQSSMETNTEVVGLSTDPIADSAFEIPPDFQETTFADLMNGQIQARGEAVSRPAALPSSGNKRLDRFYSLGDLAGKAWKEGSAEQTASYARELLAAAPRYSKDWNYGNAIHDGHMYLGLVALQQGDVAAAREHLLEAGKTTGSPQLNSFGPNMALAYALLQKGERDTVLEYFTLCRKFWELGGTQLDLWTDLVRQGQIPVFGANLQ